MEESQKVCEISKGNSFGEIVLLYNLSQNYNIIAETDVYLLTMNRSDFMKIMRIIIENEILYKEFLKLRKYSFLFSSWSNFSLGQIMNYFIPIKLIKKEILFNQKDFSDSFYMNRQSVYVQIFSRCIPTALQKSISGNGFAGIFREFSYDFVFGRG